MKSALSIAYSLKYAIRKAVAEFVKDKAFSRKSPLSLETLIRLLIGAEGGSFYIPQMSKSPRPPSASAAPR